MGNLNGKKETLDQVHVTNETADTLADEQDLEFKYGQSIIFEVGLEKANLDDTLLIRHQGATI